MAPSSRKILIVGRPKSGKLSLVKALTSTLPSGLSHENTPHAGLTHSITLTTRYYSTEAGIWIDEIPEADTDTWLNEYLSDEASVVLQSLAAVIFTVDLSKSKRQEDLEIIKKLNERGEEIEWDGICVIVGKESQEKSSSDIASMCDDHAMEFIDLNQSGQNEYGEKLGLQRVLEILHTCDWASPNLETDSLGSLQDPTELDFELNAFNEDEDMGEGSERDVDYMERMMTMLLHARELGQEMGTEERKRLAQRTIEKVVDMS